MWLPKSGLPLHPGMERARTAAEQVQCIATAKSSSVSGWICIWNWDRYPGIGEMYFYWQLPCWVNFDLGLLCYFVKWTHPHCDRGVKFLHSDDSAEVHLQARRVCRCMKWVWKLGCRERSSVFLQNWGYVNAQVEEQRWSHIWPTLQIHWLQHYSKLHLHLSIYILFFSPAGSQKWLRTLFFIWWQ